MAPTIAALPLVVTPVLGCSDRDTSSDARSPAAAAPMSVQPLKLESITDEDLREKIATMQAAKGKQEIIEAIQDVQARTFPESIPFVKPFIAHADPEIGITAVEAIEFLAISTEEGIAVFSEALTWDVAPSVRRRILEALYEQRTEIENETSLAQPMLGVLRRDADPLVRIDAAEYIAALADAKVIPDLEKQLGEERDERVRQAIDWSIRFLRNETQDPPPRFDSPS